MNPGLLGLVVVVLSIAACDVAAATRYLAIRIPQQAGYNTSADAINASGVIAGNVTRSVDDYGDEEDVAAFVFSADNTLTRIAVPGSAARAYSINKKGEIVGSFQVNGHSRAFRFDGDVTTDVSLPGAGDSSATAINDNGDVAGIAAGHAFVLRAGKVIELREESYALAINAFGQIAGFVRTSQSGYRVFYHAGRYSDGGLEDLGALGDYAYALGINASGDVVGETFGSDNLPRPFIYTEGGMRYLGTMHGSANAINAAGNVVGYQFDDGAFRVFLYADGTINALDDLTDGLDGARLVSVNAINDAGQIAARACVTGRGGECFGVRLDPMPAPP
ncbi:MAG: hypothetical protein WCB48_02295 [Casimicrobiaceae bacterium]